MVRIKAGIPRVKAQPDKVVVERVKASKTEEKAPSIERIKPKTERIYNGGFLKDSKTGMFIKDEEYYKLVDDCYFKCWPDGNIKDQKTETHVCWFGKITRKLTQEQSDAAALAIQKCMVKCFPEMYYNMETGERENKITEDGLYLERTHV